MKIVIIFIRMIVLFLIQIVKQGVRNILKKKYQICLTIAGFVDNFSKMYSNSDDWTIEIDTRLLSNKLSLTSREISAILLHEIGHLKHNTSKLNKILAEVSYTINKLGFTNKQRYLMKDTRYKRLFLYPIFNSIRMDIKSAKSFAYSHS